MAVSIVSATFTPAATSHTGGDVVGVATRFETAINIDGVAFSIKNASALVADSGAVTSAFTVHLYSITPPSAIADDAPWDLAAADRARYGHYPVWRNADQQQDCRPSRWCNWPLGLPGHYDHDHPRGAANHREACP
jgi:hypothetical protein